MIVWVMDGKIYIIYLILTYYAKVSDQGCEVTERQNTGLPSPCLHKKETK